MATHAEMAPPSATQHQDSVEKVLTYGSSTSTQEVGTGAVPIDITPQGAKRVLWKLDSMWIPPYRSSSARPHDAQSDAPSRLLLLGPVARQVLAELFYAAWNHQRYGLLVQERHHPDAKMYALSASEQGLRSNQYAWTASISYFGYLVWSSPTSYLVVRLPIGKYLAGSV